jgi:hypothetical protein
VNFHPERAKDLMSEYQGQQKTEFESANAQLDAGRIQRLLQVIYSTQPVEVGCDECFEMADLYAEMLLAGADAAKVLPLVEDHLIRCPGCREEFEALLGALRGISGIATD